MAKGDGDPKVVATVTPSTDLYTYPVVATTDETAVTFNLLAIQTAVLRGKGPAKAGTDENTQGTQIDYPAAYEDAGLTFENNTLTVDLNALLAYSDVENNDLDQLFQEIDEQRTRALFAGIAFQKPFADATQVDVSVNGTER